MDFGGVARGVLIGFLTLVGILIFWFGALILTNSTTNSDFTVFLTTMLLGVVVLGFGLMLAAFWMILNALNRIANILES